MFLEFLRRGRFVLSKRVFLVFQRGVFGVLPVGGVFLESREGYFWSFSGGVDLSPEGYFWSFSGGVDLYFPEG